MKDRKKSSFKFRFSEFLLLLLLLISTVMMSLSTGSFVINFKEIGFGVLSGIGRGVSAVTMAVKNTVNSVKELSALHEQYDILTEKLEDYEYMQRTNSDIRKENARLKELLGFSENLSRKNYPAAIISRGSDNLNYSIVIDKGSKNGIKKNMPVLAIQNGNVGVVGKVVSVGYLTSSIMPIFDIKCTVSSRIQNTRDIGLVSGNGTDNPLSMRYIKKRVIDELNYGDVVVTSGENENYMKDIPIGTITKIRLLDYDSSLDIELTPVIDFSRLENVIVVNQNESNDIVLSNGETND